MGTFGIDDGAGGLWEYHQWNGGIILNGAAGADPRYFVERIRGLHALPERSDPRNPRVARVGENAYPTNSLGKTVTYEGEILASTVAVLRNARTLMLADFSDTVSEGYMDLLPQTSDDSPVGRFYAKVLSLDIDDDVTNDGSLFRRAYSLALRLGDPRIYYPALAVDVSGNPASVTNSGSAPVDPTVTVSGASGDVTISDGTHVLTFANVPSGSLVVNFANRTAKVGTTHAELVVASSDWWDRFTDGISAGATVSIAQTGGTGVRVQFTPATWG
ncbi:MAG: hypothetical protein ACXVHX_22705 [Solirubrobacteraceae bacterium]